MPLRVTNDRDGEACLSPDSAARDALICRTESNGVARLTLNRPEVHNAFNDALIAEMASALDALERDTQVRAVILGSNGKSFSAGADLNWMRAMASYSHAENLRDAEALGDLMHRLDSLKKPTIALVQGPAFGGGVGLVACCDIAIAGQRASFCLSEVKLGLIPAVISPYVVAAMGPRAARRYFLTAERFSAEKAMALGLVHEVVADDGLDAAAESLIAELLAAGPIAVQEAKDLIAAVAFRPPDAVLRQDTAERIARIRASDEGREGLTAFLEKRPPNWRDANSR